MGIVYSDVIAYYDAKLRGVSFESAMCLGHQSLYLHRQEVADLRAKYRAEYGESPTSLADYRWGQYADEFLREFLSVSTLTVLDGSAYEGADTVHDMNQSVPIEWANRFDVVIDCGSLEHIFNVPVALSNLGKMLKVGGTIFITVPANNLMGHGFYQFSPELMFRVFNRENGFNLRSLLIREARYPSVELTRNRRIYSVTDPAEVRGRVGLQSKHPAMIMVEAVKTDDVQMFGNPPIQSDYLAAWTPPDAPSASVSPFMRAARIVEAALPRSVYLHLYGNYEKRKNSLRNERFYRRTRGRG